MPTGPNFHTLLEITGVDVPPYASRGVTQTLQPVDASAVMRRTVNGALIDMSLDQFRKLVTTLRCADQQPIAVINGVWPGKLITIKSCLELSYKTVGGVAERTAVAGSSREEGAFTFYRPELTCRVITYDIDFNEYGAVSSWTLTAEEV